MVIFLAALRYQFIQIVINITGVNVALLGQQN